ncbi:hypothetical protein, partial [Wolbachia endosymbiont of Mansonella perstans]|uniref:hypothetical protein n=1 Tax=Wolbachia endosymbiont of Mansonella perstans TaxID=229526 RepID=UPI001CE19E54
TIIKANYDITNETNHFQFSFLSFCPKITDNWSELYQMGKRSNSKNSIRERKDKDFVTPR